MIALVLAALLAARQRRWLVAVALVCLAGRCPGRRSSCCRWWSRCTTSARRRVPGWLRGRPRPAGGRRRHARHRDGGGGHDRIRLGHDGGQPVRDAHAVLPGRRGQHHPHPHRAGGVLRRSRDRRPHHRGHGHGVRARLPARDRPAPTARPRRRDTRCWPSRCSGRCCGRGTCSGARCASRRRRPAGAESRCSRCARRAACWCRPGSAGRCRTLLTGVLLLAVGAAALFALDRERRGTVSTGSVSAAG